VYNAHFADFWRPGVSFSSIFLRGNLSVINEPIYIILLLRVNSQCKM
jgi:hypothetical protein